MITWEKTPEYALGEALKPLLRLPPNTSKFTLEWGMAQFPVIHCTYSPILDENEFIALRNIIVNHEKKR